MYDNAARAALNVDTTAERMNDALIGCFLHLYSERLRPSDSPTRSLASRFVGSLRSRGLTRALVRLYSGCENHFGWRSVSLAARRLTIPYLKSRVAPPGEGLLV